MISFSEYLTEARMAPLYHATIIASANKILKDDVLYGTRQEDGASANINKKVVFFTRDLRHAKKFMENGAIFVIDQQKLSQNYKIVPFKNWRGQRTFPRGTEEKKRDLKLHKPMFMTGDLGANEFEEVVLGDIKNINRYITKIYIPDIGDLISKYPYLESDDRIEILK